jgi:hypothetical protein
VFDSVNFFASLGVPAFSSAASQSKLAQPGDSGDGGKASRNLPAERLIGIYTGTSWSRIIPLHPYCATTTCFVEQLANNSAYFKDAPD